jgi:hypothetical protein
MIPERHERVVRALQTGGPATPETLRRRVEAATRRPPEPQRTSRVWAVAAVAATTIAALAIALVAFNGAAPTVDAVAAVSSRPATEATPPPDPSQPTLLRREFEGVAFPNWSEDFGWMADGARSETIDGRAAETVFYTHHGHRISYTVLSGDPVDPPKGALAVMENGVELYRSRSGALDVVTFERNGRTCVLAGDVINPSTLVELASWQGDGTVRF